MPPKRHGRRVRYGRGVNKRGVRYSFIRPSRGFRRTTFRRKRRVGVVRGKGRRRGGKGKRKRFLRKQKRPRFPKYGEAAPSRFQKQLAIAQGSILHARRQVQCEWQVPSAKSGTGSLNFETSIYCYPRKQETTSLERYTMTYPFDNADLFNIAQNRLSLAATGIDSYQTFIMIAYTAKYVIRNQSNYAVRYEALKFKVKRNLPFVAYADPVSLQQSWGNPFNVAGAYLHRTGEGSDPGIADASHDALHKLSCEVEKLPPFKYAFSCKKKGFKLPPGGTKTFTLRGYRQFKKIDLIGMEKELSAVTATKHDHLAGSKFLVIKMMSDPADWDATETNIWNSLSTRTVPILLMSYEIQYQIRQPLASHSNSIGVLEMGTWGFAENTDNSKVQNMADADDQKVHELDVM